MQQELKVKEVLQRTYNVISFRLNAEGRAEYKAGQFLSVTLKTGPELKRYLSISSSPTETGHIEFTKKITESDFCRELRNLRAGDAVKVEYPFGKFTLQESDKKIAFLSGGIGITPIRSICRYACDSKLETQITLIYSNRTVKDIAFREDLEAMQKNCPGLKVVHTLTEAEPGFKARQGRINSAVIKEEIPDYTQRKFYICGPPLMVEAMKKIVSEELKLARENIITENFTGY